MSKSPTWREDPLSVFLVVAAVILAVMYFLEHWRADQIEDGQARAAQFYADHLGEASGCTAYSTGLAGDELVVECGGDVRANVKSLRAKLGETSLGQFRRIFVMGADELMICPPEPSTWPSRCETEQRPRAPLKDEESSPKKG